MSYFFKIAQKEHQDKKSKSNLMSSDFAQRPQVILLPLRPASLTHKNPQRSKIIHGMRPIGYKDQSIDRSID